MITNDDIDGEQEEVLSVPGMAAAEDSPLNPMSGIDAIRKKSAEVAERKGQDFDVPGYDGMLVARYRILGFDEAQAIGKRHRRKDNPRWLFNSQVDTLIEACEEILYRDEEGNIIPLSSDGPVRYDMKLADGLGWTNQVDTARQVLIKLFSNEVAILGHHEEVMNWMQKGRRENPELGEA